MDLKDRLFGCLPAGRYGLAGLLRLVDVIETDAVPTAAVECHAQPRLLVNPAFVAEHADTDEKLMMLVLHEIHHVLLGHTRRLEGTTPADNIVFDCVINALLSRMFPQPAYTALFRDFYPDDAFPACLLRPPEGWDPRVARVPVSPALASRAMAPARRVHRALYSAQGASYHDLRVVLRGLLHRRAAGLQGLRLLGDHDGSAQGKASAGADAFARGVADVVRGWPAPPEPIAGMSMSELLRTSRIAVTRSPTRRQLLRRLIAGIAGDARDSRGARRLVAEPMEVESPTPSADRRSTVLRALGATPLLHRAPIDAPRTMPEQERVHVYVDVSGSMEGVKSALYGAVLDCRELVHRNVHLFSTKVADVSPEQLRAGRCESTGGTDIGCVTRHMAKHDVRRAVLLTDGHVGRVDAAGREALKRARIGVAYFGASTSDRDLARWTAASVRLPVSA
jgi:hypothetical protein